MIREKLDVCELDKARMSILNPALIEQKKNERTIDENAKPVLETDDAGRHRDRLGPVRDATAFMQILCSGTSCSRCTMGPCRIIPPNRIRGVCGADADLIVSRNLLDMIATGSAAHSDHGRDIAETLYLVGTGKTQGLHHF